MKICPIYLLCTPRSTRTRELMAVATSLPCTVCMVVVVVPAYEPHPHLPGNKDWTGSTILAYYQLTRSLGGLKKCI